MNPGEIYNSFASKWTGKRINEDGVDGYQCVDEIKQYAKEEFGLTPGLWGNASAYWTATASALLTKFTREETNSPKKGDIVILNIDHVGISNGVVGATTFQQLDQNGGEGSGTGEGVDSIQIHTFKRSEIMGVLRPIYTPALPYIISPILTKQIVLNKQPTHEWNLAYQTFAEIEANPFSSGNLGDVKIVVAELKHNDGYTYYLENASNPVGWNTSDCNAYKPPIAAVTGTSYVPPAAPIKGTQAETYTVITPLPYYDSLDDIINSHSAAGTLSTGNYYVWLKGGANSIYYDLSTTNTKNDQKWVNILNNKTPAPVPVATTTSPIETSAVIRASYRNIMTDGSPIECQVLQNIMVTDIVSSGQVITVKKGSLLHIYGTFKKGNQWYAMPKVNASNEQAASYMYGVPIASETNLAPYLDDVFGVAEQIRYGWDSLYNKAVKTIEGIFRVKRKG